MYIVAQIYHDPDTHDALHTEFIDEYTIHSIFKDFDKAVKYAKQLNQDFEIDCVCDRLKIKYECLKQAIDGVHIIQDYKENINKNYTFIINKIMGGEYPICWCEYTKITIDNIEVEDKHSFSQNRRNKKKGI